MIVELDRYAISVSDHGAASPLSIGPAARVFP